MRLIDADELKKKLKLWAFNNVTTTSPTFDFVTEFDIDECPTVDVLKQIRAEIDSYCSDNRDRNDGLYIAMKIIDKYRKGEQE